MSDSLQAGGYSTAGFYKIKPPEPPKTPKNWYEGMQDFSAAIIAISSGSLSAIAFAFRDKLKEAATLTKTFFDSLADTFDDTINNWGIGIGEWISSFDSTGEGWLSKAADIIEFIFSGIGTIGSLLISALGSLFNFILANLGAVIELISNIGKLPDMLKKSLAGLVQGARDFGKAIVTIIKDIITNLPSILYDIITSLLSSVGDIIDALIKGLPKFFTQLGKVIPSIIKAIIDGIITVVSKIPELVYEIVNALWEGLKALFVGGEITSGITDTWNEQAKPITVELDTSGAMQALKYAQDALLGAVNETDMEIAKQALLSARQAAILAEKQKLDAQNTKKEAETKRLKGLFEYIGDIFTNLWESLKSIFSGAWEGIKGVFVWAWDGLRGIVIGLWNFLKEIPGKIWDGIKGVADLIGKAIADAWEGIKNALGLGGGGGIGGIISGVSNFVNNALHGFGLWHSGGLIKKAHSGMYLKKDEVPIIARIGEGILNDYNGMKAIGGEAGLNFANRYGSLPAAGKTEINNNQTYHQHFEVVVDKDGNVMKLTRTQAKNLARTLDPVFKEMKRNRELSFA